MLDHHSNFALHRAFSPFITLCFIKKTQWVSTFTLLFFVFVHNLSVLSMFVAFKIFDLVNTIYGTGFIAEIRSDCYVVRLTNWALAQGQSPTLYLQEDALK